MSVIDELIFDRTQADVDYVAELKRKILTDGLDSLTEEERTAYMSGLKGCYNYTDLNRISNAIRYVNDRAYNERGIDIQPYVGAYPPNDFTMAEIIELSRVGQFIPWIYTINVKLNVHGKVPKSMNRLNFVDANNIELVLYEADANITNPPKEYFFSGEIYSGEFQAY